VGLFGLLSERLVIWPLRQPTALLITLVSIGLAICTRSLVMLVLARSPSAIPAFPVRRRCRSAHHAAAQTLWIVGITLAFLVVMHVFFERSMLARRCARQRPIAKPRPLSG